MRPLSLLIIASLCGGCIFGGTEPHDGDATTPDDGTRPDVSRDVGTTDMPDGGTPDLGRPDLAPPADMGGDMPGDTGMPPDYTFEPLRPRSIAVPVRPEFLALMGNGIPVGPDLLAMIGHWRIVWGTEYEAVDATAAVPSADFALLSEEAGQDPLNLTPDDDDLAGTPWANPSIPMLVVRASLFNNTHLMDGDSYEPMNPVLRLSNTPGPLGQGLPNMFRAYRAGSSEPVVSQATRADGAEPVSMEDTAGTSWPAILGVESGTPLLEVGAAARRVGLGVEAARAYNWDGWIMFDNAVAWLTNTAIPAPRGECAVFGVNEDLRHHVGARARRNGCSVSFTPNSLTDESVVIVLPGASGLMLDDLRNHPGPIIVIFGESEATSTLGMTSSQSPAPVEAAYWDLVDSSPPWLRANISGDIQVQVAPTPTPFAHTNNLAPGARVLASILDADTQATYFVVEAGDQLLGGNTAAGDRVAIGISATNLSTATNAGYTLLDAAIQWSLQRANGM